MSTRCAAANLAAAARRAARAAAFRSAQASSVSPSVFRGTVVVQAGRQGIQRGAKDRGRRQGQGRKADKEGEEGGSIQSRSERGKAKAR